MKLPLQSYDTNFHIFFASHYVHHWFDPWNTKWFAGFSQTTYPPMPHYWIAVLSRIMGLELAYMAVQMIAILLLVVGVYRFSLLWVSPRAASIAALASVFLGSESFLVYNAGQLPTTTAAPLYLIALPFLYEWLRYGRWRAFIKATVLFIAAAAGHHLTLLFGSFIFALPVVALALLDRRREGEPASVGVHSRPHSLYRSCGKRRARGRAASLLALAASSPDQSDYNPPCQPVEFHSQPAVGPELLHPSLRSVDSRHPVHLHPRRERRSASPSADWVLADICSRPGRNDAARTLAARARV